MAKQDGKTTSLVPKLRFPEFRGKSTWKEVPLRTVLSEHKLKSDGKSEVHSVSLTHGVVSQVEHMGRSFSAADTSHYSLVRPFDVIYTRSPLAIYRLGIVKQHHGSHNAIVSPLYGVFAPANRYIGEIIEAYFDSPARSIAYLDPLAQKGAKNTIQLSNERFLSGSIVLPLDEAEQRKIAACLTSLDALIAARGRKLAALAAHKKGLMQQLFPRPGESLPRLRFPEFREKGEWKEKRLGELGSLVSGLTYSPADVQDAGLLVLRSSNVQDGRIALDDCVYVRPDVKGANLSQPNDILICVRNGSKALIGKNAMIPAGLPVCTHGAFMTVLRAAAPHFVHVLLQTKAYQQQVAADLGATINSINGSQLLRYRFNVPSPAEQQRIAACLGSLDAALAAEAQALSALRTHKKGLMQQLFPSAAAGQGRAMEDFIMRYGDRQITAADAVPGEPAKAFPAPPQKPYKIGFARQLLAAEILQHCHSHPTMGRVKLQKLIHLCEYHAELDDIHGNYARAAAGPFDNMLMRGVATGLEKQKWFKQVRGEKRTSYEPMASAGQHAKYLQRWSTQLPRIQEVIKTFANAKTLTCEIASTLYAAWNDLLIEGKQPTDADIIREASDPKRWHESKANIDEIKWPAALKWMRTKGFVPRGYGAHTTKRSGD